MGSKTIKQKFNDAIYFLHGDGGFDFKINISGFSKTCEVVWAGFVKGTNKPRMFGNLIVNPYEPNRWTNIYIVVGGSIETKFWFFGWTTHDVLVKHSLYNFGYGPKFHQRFETLNPISKLVNLIDWDK